MTLQKTVDGTTKDVQDVVLTSADEWAQKTVENLPKYEGGKLIAYSWAEKTVPEGYSLTGNSAEGTVTTLTNKHELEKKDVTATKVWIDDEDQLGQRPETIEFTLYETYADKDGVETTAAVEGVEPLTVKADKDGNWKVQWTGLPAYKPSLQGSEITYSVKETKINGIPVEEYYGYTINEEGLKVSNEPVTTGLKVKKTWEFDKANATDITEVKFQVERSIDGSNWDNVKLNGEDLTITIGREDGAAFGEAELIGLPAYDVDSNPYTYRAVEVSITVKGTEMPVVDGKVNGYTVKETHTPGEDEDPEKAVAEDLSEITNTYAAEGEIVIGGIKTLKGQDLKAGQFKFILSDDSGNKVLEATNDAEGNFVFAPIKYQVADLEGMKEKVFTYGIAEMNDRQSRITYDETVYTVKVTVTDNGDGTLTAKADKSAKQISFKNSYNPPANKTGDDANGTLWALLMALAGSALGGVVLFRRKRRI